MDKVVGIITIIGTGFLVGLTLTLGSELVHEAVKKVRKVRNGETTITFMMGKKPVVISAPKDKITAIVEALENMGKEVDIIEA